jgi:hypothetical protein
MQRLFIHAMITFLFVAMAFSRAPAQAPVIGTPGRTGSQEASARRRLVDAMEMGIPAFNEGDALGCFQIYDEALSGVLPLLDSRPTLKETITGARSEATRLRGDREKAWRLRQAIDIALETLAQKESDKSQASRVHVLLVIDTNAKQRERARDRLAALLRKGLEGQARRWTLKVLQGRDMTRQNILDYYLTLPNAGPNEALLFYYVGHGGINKTRGQLFCVNGPCLYRSELRTAMLQRQPRLAVILTDCCSTGINPNEPLPKEGQSPPRQMATPSPRGTGSVIGDLLLLNRGLVVITSAKASTSAWTGPGEGMSPFATALCALLSAPPRSFDHNKDGFVEWREFFPYLRAETGKNARAINCSQSPQAFLLGEPFTKTG